MAANFLDIKSLVDLTAVRFSFYIRNELINDIPGVRKLLGIENDFSPEEELAIMEENKWID